MTDAFSRELERQLGRLFHGGLSPYAFRRWFASALWDAERSSDAGTLTFAYEVENIIAERSGSHISDQEMIAALHAAARTRPLPAEALA
jgi:hypothetical protein